MADAGNGYEYRVERDLGGSAQVDVKLVRYELKRGRFGSRHEVNGTVLFHRGFKPRLELDRLEAYASVLQQVADHANDGTFGCFVETESRDGDVEIALYERWFDGDKLRCEDLARRRFDAGEEVALVSSAEFRGELEQWAEDQNEAREQSYLDAAADDRERTARATERIAAANGLAGILARDSGR